MEPEKIAVSALGDPRARSTWSGTPFHLCRTLDAMGRLGPTYNAEAYAPQPIPRLVRLAARLYYGNSHESSRGKITRFFRERGLGDFLESKQPRHVLHLGSLALPLRRPSSGTQHYLLSDSTWHLWSRDSTKVARCRPKLLRDAEELERRVYGQMTLFFPLSEYVGADLVTHYGVDPDKIVVVGTGRGSIAPFAGTKDYARGPILFVAKDRFADKGGELLVEGFKLAATKNASLHLVLAGNPAYVRWARLHPRISAHGYVSLEQLQRLFDEAALFAMPALNEPWGLVYLEALSCRAPILALNRNAAPELTRQGAYGFCVREPSAEAVAEALLEAFSDPNRLAEMGQAGQDYSVNHFTWENTARRIVEAIDRASPEPSLSHSRY